MSTSPTLADGKWYCSHASFDENCLACTNKEIERLTGWLVAIRRLPTTATLTEAVVMAGDAYQTKKEPPPSMMQSVYPKTVGNDTHCLEDD